jgi:type II secretory pathway pseudopilin PulG
VKIAHRRGRGAGPSSARSAGVAFVELVISAVVLGWVLLAVFPLFLSSVRANAAASSYGEVNGLVRTRLEQLLELPFEDPRLLPGRHSTNDLPATLPDPETGAFPSTVANPFRRTYRVRQFEIPAAATVPPGAPFTSIRVTEAGRRFDFKRIEVTAEKRSAWPEPGLIAARVSGLLPNPAPAEIFSREDPDP